MLSAFTYPTHHTNHVSHHTHPHTHTIQVMSQTPHTTPYLHTHYTQCANHMSHMNITHTHTPRIPYKPCAIHTHHTCTPHISHVQRHPTHTILRPLLRPGQIVGQDRPEGNNQVSRNGIDSSALELNFCRPFMKTVGMQILI
jgi:hypothetical protein